MHNSPIGLHKFISSFFLFPFSLFFFFVSLSKKKKKKKKTLGPTVDGAHSVCPYLCVQSAMNLRAPVAGAEDEELAGQPQQQQQLEEEEEGEGEQRKKQLLPLRAQIFEHAVQLRSINPDHGRWPTPCWRWT
jgi:hypothetical protein